MSKLSSICEKIIAGGFYFLFLLVPLVFTPWTRELFEFPKMLLVYALTTIIAAAFLVRIVINGKWPVMKTPLDKPILAFLIIYFISTLFSLNRYTSIFGYYTRFNGGLLSIICFVTLYYILNSSFIIHHSLAPSRHPERAKRTKDLLRMDKMLFCLLFSSFLVSIWGILEHFGIDKNYWKQNVQARVFSTLGQPNWLAAYLAAVIPIPLSLLIFDPPTSPAEEHLGGVCRFHLRGGGIGGQIHKLLTVSCLFLVITTYTATWFTYSLSGLLGLLAALATFFILTPKANLRKRWKTFAVLAATCIVISLSSPGLFLPRIKETLSPLRHSEPRTQVTGEESLSVAKRFFPFALAQGQNDNENGALAQEKVGTSSQSLTPKALELGGRTGRIRLIVWKGTLDLIFSDPKNTLIGTGPETFAYAFLPYRPKELNQTIEWDFLYNKAHNEYLNLGACVGLLGLGSYLWFIGKFIFFTTHVILSLEHQSRGEESSSVLRGFLRQTQDDKKRHLLVVGIFSGWISLLITSFFGFHVVATSLLFWLYPAIILNFKSSEEILNKTG